MEDFHNLSLEDTRLAARSWIERHAPSELAGLIDWHGAVERGLRSAAAFEQARAHPAYRQWHDSLVAAGFVCAEWPKEYGGGGLSDDQIRVVDEEFRRAGVPRPRRGIGESLVGPTVLKFGTPEQKSRFLPRIVTGEDVYCQGFSEPENGSDLVRLRTTGVVSGDEIVVTGRKIWTTLAQRSNMMLLLCRTDADAPPRSGITLVLMPMEDNNIDVRPIQQMTGEPRFCEEILEGARAPLTNVIGPLNEGWRVATSALSTERSGARSAVDTGTHEVDFWAAVENARRSGRLTSDVIRRRLTSAYIDLRIVALNAKRTIAAGSRDDIRIPESIVKVVRSESRRRLGELGIDVLGAEGLIRPEGEEYLLTRPQETFLFSRSETIFAGTSEIQRTIIAERVLGLPR